jgi:hypothetical protein
VTDVLVVCCRPLRLGAVEAGVWLRDEVRKLLADDAITQIQVTALTDASSGWGRTWDYLIRISLDGADTGRVMQEPACDGLLGDLRLLGMRPYVAVADGERTVTLTRRHS